MVCLRIGLGVAGSTLRFKDRVIGKSFWKSHIRGPCAFMGGQDAYGSIFGAIGKMIEEIRQRIICAAYKILLRS